MELIRDVEDILGFFFFNIAKMVAAKYYLD
jgi:hypothetical protein